MAEGRTNGDISRIFSYVIASGIQMKNMINNLLDFTRLRFGQTLPRNTLVGTWEVDRPQARNFFGVDWVHGFGNQILGDVLPSPSDQTILSCQAA